MVPKTSRAIVVVLICCFELPSTARSGPDDQFVAVGGRRMHVRTANLDEVDSERPLVVFESGLGARLDYWGAVFTRVAEFAPVLAYDRAGIGQSEPDGAPPTPIHVAQKLRALLSELNLYGPHILVGHSLGGPFVRMFAALYPSDVAGLVYVDPTDLRSEADERQLFRSLGYNDTQAAAQRAAMQRETFPDTPYGAEMKEARDLSLTYFEAFRDVPPTPDVPAAVLLAGKFEPGLWTGKPCEARRCHDAWIRFRSEAVKPLIRGESDAFTIAAGSGHGIPQEDPDLVAWAVRHVLQYAQHRAAAPHQ
jgi:pimeloyl-ACP methyl ester carboxylesterase